MNENQELYRLVAHATGAIVNQSPSWSPEMRQALASVAQRSLLAIETYRGVPLYDVLLGCFAAICDTLAAPRVPAISARTLVQLVRAHVSRSPDGYATMYPLAQFITRLLSAMARRGYDSPERLELSRYWSALSLQPSSRLDAPFWDAYARDGHAPMEDLSELTATVVRSAGVVMSSDVVSRTMVAAFFDYICRSIEPYLATDLLQDRWGNGLSMLCGEVAQQAATHGLPQREHITSPGLALDTILQRLPGIAAEEFRNLIWLLHYLLGHHRSDDDKIAAIQSLCQRAITAPQPGPPAYVSALVSDGLSTDLEVNVARYPVAEAPEMAVNRRCREWETEGRCRYQPIDLGTWCEHPVEYYHEVQPGECFDIRELMADIRYRRNAFPHAPPRDPHYRREYNGHELRGIFEAADRKGLLNQQELQRLDHLRRCQEWEGRCVYQPMVHNTWCEVPADYYHEVRPGECFDIREMAHHITASPHRPHDPFNRRVFTPAEMQDIRNAAARVGIPNIFNHH